MTLYTKSIFSQKDLSDGLRISVMSRHTLNDGKTLDTRIQEGREYDLWIKEFAPPAQLVGKWYNKKICWEIFQKGYEDHLRKSEITQCVKKLARDALKQDITILCVEENAHSCHRSILADECKKYEKELEIVHR